MPLPGRGPARAISPGRGTHQAALFEPLADRLLGHPNLRGDLAVGQARVETRLGARQDVTFELARPAGPPPLHL